ncbi:hypothetical protein BH10PSE1_BH10PSE1_06670 [soil metagenome]
MATNHDDEDQQALAHGLRLAVIAIVSAVMTATLVIGVGGAWLDRGGHTSTIPVQTPGQLIRTSG